MTRQFLGLAIIAAMVAVTAMLLMPSKAAAQSGARDNSLAVACLESGRLSGSEVDAKWCQCQNDYYAKLLTDADWAAYTSDYFALKRKKYSEASTKPNSYARYVQIGDSACRICLENDYRGCFRDDGVTPSTTSYERIFRDLRDGQFDKIPRNTLYKSFFVDFVNGYSASCGDRMTSYVEQTVTVQRWKNINHVWYDEGTTVNKTRIAPELVNSYLAYEKTSDNAAVMRMLQSVMGSLQRQEIPFGVITESMNSVIKPSLMMERMLAGKCTNTEVQSAYTNLKQFEFGRSPMTPAALQLKRSLADNEQQSKYSAIRAAMPANMERSRQLYQQEQARKAQLPKGEVSCSEVYNQGHEQASVMRDTATGTGQTLNGVEGVYAGSIAEKPLELAIWNTGRNKDYAIGFGYFPQDDCLMSIQFRDTNKRNDRQKRVQMMDMNMFSPNWRAGNCASMVIEDFDKEIHFFTARGFINIDNADKELVWLVNNSKLGQNTPQSCTGGPTVLKAGAKMSPAFAALLRQHKYPDRYADPVPESVLRQVK